MWAKFVLFRKVGCNWAKIVVFGQKWLYSGKSGFIRAKVVVFRESGCIRAKAVVFEQKWL